MAFTPQQIAEASRLLNIDASDEEARLAALRDSPLAGFGPKVAKLPVSVLTTGEKDTGFDLPTKGIVLDVYVDVQTKEDTGSTKTIDVGLLSSESGGDADGFLDGVVTSAAGVVGPAITITDGTNQNFVAANPKLGALLRQGELGGDAAGTASEIIKTGHILNGTAKSVTYTLGSAHTELVADIIVVYLDFS